MNMKVLLLGLAVVGILALISMYGFGISFGRGLQGFQNPASENSFTMYYADWCPHCQTAKPDFQKLVDQGEVKVGEKRCVIRMVSPENEPEKARGKPVRGFPTFLLETTEGETVEYKGERNTQGYLEFINQKLGGGI
jgi:thiol-disulfide isomerase/thioredoxin